MLIDKFRDFRSILSSGSNRQTPAWVKVFLGIDDQKGVAARSYRVIIGVVLDDATAKAAIALKVSKKKVRTTNQEVRRIDVGTKFQLQYLTHGTLCGGESERDGARVRAVPKRIYSASVVQ